MRQFLLTAVGGLYVAYRLSSHERFFHCFCDGLTSVEVSSKPFSNYLPDALSTMYGASKAHVLEISQFEASAF
jgi:hypothetical protein